MTRWRKVPFGTQGGMRLQSKSRNTPPNAPVTVAANGCHGKAITPYQWQFAHR